MAQDSIGDLPAPMSWWDIEMLSGDCWGIHDRQLAELACRAVLDVVRDRLSVVVVDAYTDHRKQLSSNAVALAAQVELHRRGKTRGRRDPGMRLRLDPVIADDWALVKAYAPWSINVDLYARPGETFTGELHDCGHSIDVQLTGEESMRLTAVIGPPLTLKQADPRNHPDDRQRPRSQSSRSPTLAWLARHVRAVTRMSLNSLR